MKLETVLGEVFSVPPEEICDSLNLQTMEAWDSMTHMVMIFRLEEEFEIQFSGDEIADIRCIGDIRKILKEKGQAE